MPEDGGSHKKDSTIFIILLLAIVCMAIFVTSCTREKSEKVSLSETEIQPSPWSEQKGLKIAVSAMTSPKETVIYYREILDYISDRMGIPVEMVLKDTYAEVNDLLRDKKIEAAFVCTGAYVDGHRDFAMELLVAPVAYGQPYYYSYIIVHRDSGFRTFEDLRGRQFAFTDPMSNTGKLVPAYMLAGMDETADSFFSHYIYTYSHDKSIEAVGAKLVDGASVDSLVWDYINATNPEFTANTKIIAKSPPYGIPPIVVPAELSSDIKENMRNILMKMHLDDAGKSILDKVKIDRFIIIDDSAYDSVRQMRYFIDQQKEN